MARNNNKNCVIKVQTTLKVYLNIPDEVRTNKLSLKWYCTHSFAFSLGQTLYSGRYGTSKM